jgi:hypothetical protein
MSLPQGWRPAPPVPAAIGVLGLAAVGTLGLRIENDDVIAVGQVRFVDHRGARFGMAADGTVGANHRDGYASRRYYAGCTASLPCCTASVFASRLVVA